MKAIRRSTDLKVGDLVRVDYTPISPNCHHYNWTGICNWHDGSFDNEGKPVGNAYKFTFIVISDGDALYEPNEEITWTIEDLRQSGAKVISESKSR